MFTIKQFFSNNKKRVVIGLVILLALSLPFVVNQVLKQQDIRQNASAAPAIRFYFSDSQVLTPTPTPNGVIRVGNIVEINILMDTKTNDIGALHYKITYPTGYLENISANNNPEFQTISSSNVDGNYEVTMVNPTINPITGLGLAATRFQFKAKKAGTVKFTISGIQATASRFDTLVPIDTSSQLEREITIIDDGPTGTITPSPSGLPTPSTTPDICVAPTGLWPNGCSCTSDNQCLNGACYLNGNNVKQCSYPLTPTPTLTPTATLTPSATPTQVPTLTPVPTATIVPGATTLAISASIPGIGLPTGYNKTPVHATREISMILRDFTTKAQVGGEIKSNLEYDTVSGTYKGMVNLGATPTGQYDVKIKMHNTLYKMQLGIVVTKSTANTLAVVFKLVPSDINQNNEIELQDYNLAVACYRDEAACTDAIKARYDINDNGVTKGEIYDFLLLQDGFGTIIRGD